MSKPLYIVEHLETGQIFDFFDLTWNASIEQCIAPYTTRNSGATKDYITNQRGYFVQIGWVDRNDTE